MDTRISLEKLFSRLTLTALVLALGALIPLSAHAQTQTEQAKNDAAVTPAESVTANPGAVPASPKPAPPPGTYSWTGGYVGGHFGYGWGRTGTTFSPLPSAAAFINMAPTTLKANPSGVAGGGQVGFNWQSGIWVIGAEFDIEVNNAKGTKTVTPITQNNGTPFPGAGFQTTTQEITWGGNLRPRLGITPANRVLLYITSGLAFGHINDSANVDFRPFGTTQYPASLSKMKTGYTAGGGGEFSINNQWSVRGEYLFVDLGSETITASATPALPPFQVNYLFTHRQHTVNFGVNFHF